MYGQMGNKWPSTLRPVDETEMGKWVQEEHQKVSSVTVVPVIASPPLGGGSSLLL